jgi:hypothetical protein
MFDRQTGSYWSHVTGEALEGPLEGARLSQIPATVTTFAEWVEEHPHTRVLRKEWNEGLFSHYERYKSSERQGILGTQARRRELDPKAVVQGVAIDGDAAAVHIDALEEGAVITFELASLPLAAVRSGSAVVIWNRRLANRLLRLEPVEGETGRLRDRTGSAGSTSTRGHGSFVERCPSLTFTTNAAISARCRPGCI